MISSNTYSAGNKKCISRRDEYFSPLDAAERHRNQWFLDDVRRLTALYYHLKEPNTSSIFSTLEHLMQIANVEATPTSRLLMRYIFSWGHGGFCGGKLYEGPDQVDCPSATIVVLEAVGYGLHELWPAEVLDESLREIALHLIEESLASYSSVCRDYFLDPKPPFDRLLRSAAKCLADGTSPNSLVRVDANHVPVTVWQNLAWGSIISSNPRASFAPVWLLFLLHGANQDFTLTFERSCNFDEVDKTGKLVTVEGRWGSEKRQVHEPIFVREDHHRIFGLAKCQDWSVSLRDITYFWFPKHVEQFRRVYDLHENGNGSFLENLEDVRRDLGLDPQLWRNREWEIPQSLFQDWEGSSEIVNNPDIGYDLMNG